MKKKILIIGNKVLSKQLTQEQIDYINSFDIIIRVNRMNNIEQTGGRVDWWWVDHTITKYKFDDIYCKNLKKIFLNNTSTNFFRLYNVKSDLVQYIRLRCYFKNLPRNIEIKKNPNYLATSILGQNKYWDASENLKTIPTTFVICVSHIINEYSDTHDIYFTCTDLEGREILYKTNEIWSTYWHRNVGKYEEDYLKMLITTNKAKFIDLEND